MRIPILNLIIAAKFAAPLTLQSSEEPKHLLVAKFTLQRLEKVDLTNQQLAAFNELSTQLRHEIDALRSKVGIGKEVMARRDEAHRALKELKLEDEDYWKRLQAKAKLTDDQLRVFKTTADKFRIFKTNVNALLTDDQEELLKKGSRKSTQVK